MEKYSICKMTGDQINAAIFRYTVFRLESGRDDYARAVEWHAKTRADYHARGTKMSATYQLKKADKRLASIYSI